METEQHFAPIPDVLFCGSLFYRENFSLVLAVVNGMVKRVA
jgi:hypothetical protein